MWLIPKDQEHLNIPRKAHIYRSNGPGNALCGVFPPLGWAEGSYRDGKDTQCKSCIRLSGKTYEFNKNDPVQVQMRMIRLLGDFAYGKISEEEFFSQVPYQRDDAESTVREAFRMRGELHEAPHEVLKDVALFLEGDLTTNRLTRSVSYTDEDFDDTVERIMRAVGISK